MTGPRDILDAIAHDARVLRRARMLPTDRPLTPPEIRQVAKDVKEWMAESGFSLGAIEKALGEGYSKTTVSAFLKSTYSGDCEKVARGLNTFMEQQVQRAEVATPQGFIPFVVAKKMLAVCKHACDFSAVGLIVACSGVGKTMCAEFMHKSRPGSILYSVFDMERSPAAFVKELAALLGIPTHRTSPQILRAICSKLKGSNRLLIIDEAHNLSDRAMETVRNIHDATRIPIVLFSTDEILPLINDTATNLGQMSRRVRIRYNAADDVQAHGVGPGGRPVKKSRDFLFSVAEIEQRFAREQLRLTDDAISFLFLVANAVGHGCMGLAVGLVEVAVRIGMSTGLKAVDRGLLLQVLKQFHGDVYIDVLSERSEQFGRPRLVATA